VRISILSMLLDGAEAAADGGAEHLAAVTSEQETMLHGLADTWVPFKPDMEELAGRVLGMALRAGVDIDAVDTQGCTALHMAAAARNDFGSLLVAAGADVR
jgi:hypothetical protein